MRLNTHETEILANHWPRGTRSKAAIRENTKQSILVTAKLKCQTKLQHTQSNLFRLMDKSSFFRECLHMV